ncbi:MAG: Cell division protein FtsH [uncultured Solirubrobacteraceae bacterium]|uniref:ATP-dependent zinc metalloprotease FtsH n=1 Tax=uncultured Solirubrobacteraceae bacterium TaxID=1162706 RepID=A0A6J4SB95_9ACTN|nr:MAG: Cell division protein FtsH [uncultured Solirubrobacteraceae bacterium]
MPTAPKPDAAKPTRPRLRPQIIAALFVLLALNYAIASAFNRPEPTNRVPYSPTFLQQVRDGNVARISTEGTTVDGEFKRALKYPPDSKQEPAKNFETEIPTFADNEALSRTLEENDVVISAEPINQGPGILTNLILGFGPILLIVGLFVYFARRAARQGGGGGLNPIGGFGRSRARRAEGSEQRVSFKDVAGIDESKAELTEVVDFLKNPERYQRLGGRIPRGVLLSGQPGTGKTLLARAVAGEADVPFFSISASEFVEAIVGIGASRVRDLFKNAKEAAPAIIFIDELDAIGRSRSSGSGIGSGANDEREQTLNQILTEMDGFETNETVIVVAATNRPEILDAALLRPGRFDRRVAVPAPDKAGRRMILDVHTRSVPLDPDVDLDRLAASTPGMVGADLANLANEAALLAARREHERVQNGDLTDALEKIILGAPRGILLSEADRRLTAYHESGHALVGMLTPGADPVRKVSIIPRGQALGVTLSAPDEDPFNYDLEGLLAKIDVALGGRVAEEVVFGTITTGAESDIQQLTRIARAMVGRWGMSAAIGPVAVVPSEGQGPLLPGTSEVSETTQRVVDDEVRRIADEAHVRVHHLLSEHRSRLDSMVDALLEHETLDQLDAYAAAGVPVPDGNLEALPGVEALPPARAEV